MNIHITDAEVQAPDILAELERHARREYVTDHPFLRRLKKDTLTKSQVAVIIGQYWYPIHYFTEFLPNVIAIVQDLSIRTYVSKILWQELGEGDPARAHETLYVETMISAGIDVHDIRDRPALPASYRLVEGYRQSTLNPLSAIGFLYGTEIIDLAMVSSVGAAVRNATGILELPWVDIHLKQEPDHISSVRRAVSVSLTEKQRRNIIDEAQKVWMLWSDFFYNIQQQIDTIV
jgi:pyrroloquinoline quinone (PQQ) biosynthesis protein C